jgi:S-formylglutathione hydrolase FrmB/RimJ/RimL family protein N-acetyltransferase
MMKRLFDRWSGDRKPSAALPRRCRWEQVPAGNGRSEWIIVCPPQDSGEAALSPVLYLLHGSGHSPLSYFTLLPMASLLPLVPGVCLVFVNGKKGWYLDSPMDAASRGEQAFLRAVQYVESRLPVGQTRERRGICGFSMGGFGAMHLASRHPDLFTSASSILGPLDIGALWPNHDALRRLLGPDRETWQAFNPAAHVDRLAGMQLLATTGLQAWDRPLNQSFADACRSHGVDLLYAEHPGEHGTEFVAAHLREHLEFHVRALGRAPERWAIRPVTQEDAVALARNCFSGMSAEEVARHVAWSLDEAARGRRVHLVVDMGEAVANGELSITGYKAEISTLVVRGPLQGRGLGSNLIRALTQEAVLRGVLELEIGVRTADTRTRALYERHGFAAFREGVMPIGGQSIPVTYLRKQIEGTSGKH